MVLTPRSWQVYYYTVIRVLTNKNCFDGFGAYIISDVLFGQIVQIFRFFGKKIENYEVFYRKLRGKSKIWNRKNYENYEGKNYEVMVNMK